MTAICIEFQNEFRAELFIFIVDFSDFYQNTKTIKGFIFIYNTALNNFLKNQYYVPILLLYFLLIYENICSS